ncbi:MAG TPA: helix-turn-helix domain-containing protein [Acidimicrobiales bacterium]|nr:helix-turn-helix domain-containing protein [Acidimicrobiales bacterium]
MTNSETTRRRSNRAIANDLAIRSAAIEEVLRVGVDRVSLRDVGHRAGLTHGATYARYEEVDELLVDLWTSVLHERMTSIVETAMRAATAPSAENVAAAIDKVRNATGEDTCAIHLLLAARRIPTLQEEVAPFVDAYLKRESCESRSVSAPFTRGLTIFAMMISRILSDYHFGRDDQSLDDIADILLDTLVTNPTAAAVVECRSPQSPFILPDGDDLRTQLAAATIQVIAKTGYTNATMSRIARRASCSPGAIYKVFSSKEDLVASTFVTSLQSRWMPLGEFVKFLDEGVLSQYLFDLTSPQNANERNFMVEFGFASTINETIRAAMSAHVEELLSVVPHLENATKDQKALLDNMIQLFSHLSMGAMMLGVAADSFQCANFSQFTEPFRQAILKRVAASWADLCDSLQKYEANRQLPVSPRALAAAFPTE